jgi:hypothetical protein
MLLRKAIPFDMGPSNFTIIDKYRRKDLTPLMLAADLGDLKMVKLLIRYGARPSLSIATLNNEHSHHAGCIAPLVFAAWRGHKEIVRHLVQFYIEDSEAAMYALYHAAMQGHMDCVRILAEEGIRPQKRRFVSKWQLVIEALLLGRDEVAEYLMALWSLDVNDPEEMPLVHAAGFANMPRYVYVKSVCEKLVKLGADVNLHDSNGLPSIMAMVQRYRMGMNMAWPEMVLLQLGADVAVTDNDDCTPLSYILHAFLDAAFRNRRASMVSMHVQDYAERAAQLLSMIHAGIDVNRKSRLLCPRDHDYEYALSSDGEVCRLMTPLEMALRGGSLIMAQMLWISGSVRGEAATWGRIPYYAAYWNMLGMTATV